MPPEVVRVGHARQRKGGCGKEQNGAEHNPNSAHSFLHDSY